MKIVGLIAEYNPFHNGHLYHIAKAKELTGADRAVVIMSGDYVQRGVPAIMPKRLRAEMALKCGASAVFELPVFCSTGSAEIFAESAVSLLDSLGIVDSICFGSESGILPALKRVADILADEPDEYRMFLQKNLKNGMSYPSARQNALKSYLPAQSGLWKLLKDPNNILGVEYLKALKKYNSPITPYTIKREGAHYHDLHLHPSHSSASAIRSLLAYSSSMQRTSCDDVSETAFEDPHLLSELEAQVPPSCLELLSDYHRISYPVYQNDFSLLLKYKLLNKTPETLIRYMDVSEELANRICGQLDNYFHYKQFCELLKTREITQTRINRALLHIMLGIRKTTVETAKEAGYHYYARLLGFRKDSEKVISKAAKNSRIPVLTRLYDCASLPETGRALLTQDILASNLYASVVTEKYRTAYENEYRQRILKV